MKKLEDATGEEIAMSLAQAYQAKDNAVATIQAHLAELDRRKQQEPQQEE